VLVEFVAEQAADRQMLVLTCHEHVAKTFAAAGAHVRSFTDPAPLFGTVATVPASLPKPRPKPKPEPPPLPPVVEATPIAPEPVSPPVNEGDLWPAEAFFFGSASNAPKRSRRR
jgi:hypothetical protein